jgi:hypothetical protein
VTDTSGQVPILSLPHESTPLFTGREDILSQLENYFLLGDSNMQKQCVFVLHGLGGAGKTQITLKFVDTFYNRCGPFII